MIYFLCALINVPFIISSGGTYWWNSITFGFCIGLMVSDIIKKW